MDSLHKSRDEGSLWVNMSDSETTQRPCDKLGDWAWDSDIEACVMTLDMPDIRNLDYWRSTVGKVEDGYNPDGKGRIIRSGLEEWVARCKTPNPDDEELHHAHRPRLQDPPNGYVQDNGAARDNRRFRRVHPHHR